MAPALLDRLLGRDVPPAAAPPEPEEQARLPEPAERALRAEIAQKLLHAWAQNRQQVLVPLTLNLARMEPAERGLILQAMAAALAACGVDADGTRLTGALRRAGGGAEEAAALETRPDLLRLLAELEAARLGAQAYAAAALLLDRRAAVERAFLDFLAARFALPPSLTAGLARRYRR